jgi:hypothetical protein
MAANPPPCLGFCLCFHPRGNLGVDLLTNLNLNLTYSERYYRVQSTVTIFIATDSKN